MFIQIIASGTGVWPVTSNCMFANKEGSYKVITTHHQKFDCIDVGRYSMVFIPARILFFDASELM